MLQWMVGVEKDEANRCAGGSPAKPGHGAAGPRDSRSVAVPMHTAVGPPKKHGNESNNKHEVQRNGYGQHATSDRHEAQRNTKQARRAAEHWEPSPLALA